MRSSKLLPLSGVLSVVLIAAGFVAAGDTPDADASLDEVSSFYADHTSEMIASAVALALGALFFLVYATAITGALRRRQGESGGASALGFGGGVVFAVGLLIFAGLSFALGDVGDKIDPAAVQTLSVLNTDLFLPAATGIAAFLLGTGAGVVKTGLLPTWLGWAAIVIGVLALTPAGFIALPLLGIWMIVSGVMVSMQADDPPASAQSI